MNDTIQLAATTTATATTTMTGQVASAVASQFGATDYTVFGVLLMASAAIGVYFGFFDGTEQTTEEYLFGGRRMRPIPVAFSLIASQLSAYSFIVVPSETYSFGSNYTMSVVPSFVCMTLVVNYLILPVFYNNNIDNCYGYLEMRFGKEMKSLITFMFMFVVLLILPIGSFTPAFAFSQISGLNLHMINAVVSIVCITYTMLGGVKAVIWTDVMQSAVMVVSLVAVPTLALIRIGGVGEMVSRAVEGGRFAAPITVLDLETRQTVWNIFSSMFLMWMAGVGFSQGCIQRLSSLPTLKDAQLTMFVFMVGVITIKLTVALMGVIMYAYYYDCDPVASGIISKADQLVPYFVNEIVGHISGMPGLFISSVFSASLSTVSALLNCISGVVYRDYVCKIPSYRHSEPRANIIMKLIIVVTGVYCIGMGFLVERSKSLFQLQEVVAGLSTGSVVGVFTLGLFYPWASRKASMCAVVTGMVLMAWLIIGSMMYPKVYTPLPTSIDGCVNVPAIEAFAHLISSSTTTELPSTSTMPLPPPIAAPFSIFSISFQWYPLIGTLIVWIVGVVLSHTLYPLEEPVESKLVSPLIQWLAPNALANQPRHIEMQIVEGGGGSDKKSRPSVVTETKYTVR